MRSVGEWIRRLGEAPVDAELRARVLGFLLALGGALTGLSVLLPHTVEHASWIWALAGVSVVAGGVVAVAGVRLGTRSTHLVVALAALLINLAVLASGSASGLYALMFFWIATGAALFFSLRAVMLHIAWCLAGYAVVLAVLGSSAIYSGLTRWVIVAFSLLVCGFVLSTVSQRQQNTERAKTLFFDLSADMLCVLDSSGALIDFNRRWSDVLGYSPAELTSRRVIEFVHPDDREPTLKVVRELLAGGGRAAFESRVIVEDGGVRWLRWSAASGDHGSLLFARATDVTEAKALSREREELVDELDHQAREDPLTGLPNRRWLRDEMAREIARATRQGFALCAAIVDIDNFKRFNDTLGHQEGDALLIETADTWRLKLRATDFLARYGGDEFVALLPACDLDAATETMSRLRQATPRGASCSIGVTQWQAGDSPEALIARADEALYVAKADGRDRVEAARA